MHMFCLLSGFPYIPSDQSPNVSPVTAVDPRSSFAPSTVDRRSAMDRSLIHLGPGAHYCVMKENGQDLGSVLVQRANFGLQAVRPNRPNPTGLPSI